MEPTQETEGNGSSGNRDQTLSRVLLVIGLLLVGGALLVYRYSPAVQPGTVTRTTGVDIPSIPPPAIRGQPAPEFELPDLNDNVLRKADFAGKILLVNFWATWCAPCLIEMPWFVEFKEQYGPQGFEVLAISLDEDVKVVPGFIEKHNFGSLTIVMGDQKTADLFGGFPGLPTSFMVDREGNFYSKHLGLVDKETLESEILELMRLSHADATGDGS